MYGFVNQGDQSAIDEYHRAAKEVDTNISPDSGPFGGVLAANPNATAVFNSTSSSPSTATTSATASANASGADAVVAGGGRISVALVVGVVMVALLMAA